MKNFKDFLINENYDTLDDFVSDDVNGAVIFHALDYALKHVGDKDWPTMEAGPEGEVKYNKKQAEKIIKEFIELCGF